MLDHLFVSCHTPSRSSHRGLAHDGDQGGKEPGIVGLGKCTLTNESVVGPPPRFK